MEVGKPPAGPYQIRELPIRFNGEAGGGTPEIRLPLSRNPYDTVGMSLDLDEAGLMYINLSIRRLTGWKSLSCEAFFGKLHRNVVTKENPSDWCQARGYKSAEPSSLDDGWKKWRAYERSGRSGPHPGFDLTYAETHHGFVVDKNLHVVNDKDGEIHPEKSSLLEKQTITDDQVKWFNDHIPLAKDYGDRTRLLSVRVKDQVQTGEVAPRFVGGNPLGSDHLGNRLFLLDIDVPPRTSQWHGVSDYIMRVYVLSPNNEIVFSAEAYPEIHMDSRSGDLFEVYGGAYRGLVPSFDDADDTHGLRAPSVRIWSAR